MAKAKKSKSSKKSRKAVKRVKPVKRAKSRVVIKRLKAPKRTVKKVAGRIKLKRVKTARKIRTPKVKKKARRVEPSLRELKIGPRREVQTQIAQLESKVAREFSGEPNLLVTFDPNKAASAKEEIQQLLREVNESGRIEETNISGVFQVAVSNPKELVRKLNSLCRNSPDKFSRTFHWTPVDRWCSSNVDTMANTVQELANNISDNEKWKMLIEKRNYDLHERDLVIKLTEKINKPNVDLKNPDKIIKVDILGDRAGISVLRSDELLNVTHFKK